MARRNPKNDKLAENKKDRIRERNRRERSKKTQVKAKKKRDHKQCLSCKKQMAFQLFIYADIGAGRETKHERCLYCYARHQNYLQNK